MDYSLLLGIEINNNKDNTEVLMIADTPKTGRDDSLGAGGIDMRGLLNYTTNSENVMKASVSRSSSAKLLKKEKKSANGSQDLKKSVQ